MPAFSNYLENKLIDWFFRNQTFTPPSTIYVALYTVAPTAAGGGTEVSGGAYARVAVASSLANWAGTQATGSTTASTGTSGTTSNNGSITFPTPTAAWGTIVAFGLFDALTSGNLLYFGPLITNQTPGIGSPAPTFAASALSITET